MTRTKRQKALAKMRREHPEIPRPTHCGCTNRGGGDKVMHTSRQAALTWMMRHLRKSSGFTLYRCPKVRGIYHVATDRRR